MLPDHQIDHPRPSTPVLYDLSFLPPHLLEPENLAFILVMCDLGTAPLDQKRQNKSVSPGTQRTPEAPPLITASLLHLPQQLLAICRGPQQLSPQRPGRQSLSSQQSSQGANQKEDLGRGKLPVLALTSAGRTGLEREELGALQLFLNTELGPMP